MLKKSLLFCVVCSLFRVDTEASTIRNGFIDNINSGLKMLGKNGHRVYITHRYPYNRLPSGISNNVADLVSQTFAPVKTYGKRTNFRQDAIVLGDVDVLQQVPSDTNFMGGMLKLLGFDSSKVSAAAVNGLIFIAQMVRYGATRVMTFMMDKTWDWYKIVDYIGERMKNEGSPFLPPTTTERIIIPPNGKILLPLAGKVLVYSRA
jgi:hypothetical protein